MTSHHRLAAALIGAAMLIGAAGCQTESPQTQGTTVKSDSVAMPTLPEDPVEAKAVVRAMMMKEAVVLLKASGVKFTGAQFDVPPSFDEDGAQNGELQIWFQPCSDEQVKAMTAAIWAQGWVQGGMSHGLAVRKGPLSLDWGMGADGCDFRMTTVNIRQHMLITDARVPVPELAAFKTPS